MKVQPNAKLRVISGSMVLYGITRKQVEKFLLGNVRNAFDRAIEQIESVDIYRGVSGVWYNERIQIDVLNSRHH
jgi:hypothetical protein